MSYSDGNFSAVLDKGTLDALYTDTSPEVEATVQGMWEEVERVTRVGGRYLTVSLLQVDESQEEELPPPPSYQHSLLVNLPDPEPPNDVLRDHPLTSMAEHMAQLLK